MSSRLLSGDAAECSEPMLWLSVGQPLQPAIEYAHGTAESAMRQRERGQAAVDEAQIELRVREAREAGRREGELSGRQAAQGEIRAALERLATATQQLAELRPQLRLQAEGDLIRLAVAIASRILRRELHIDPDALAGLVHAALEKLRLQEVNRIRVHPEHQAAIQTLLARAAGAARVDVVGDPGVTPGAAIFETTRGDIDASVETQLREIERGLADRIRR